MVSARKTVKKTKTKKQTGQIRAYCCRTVKHGRKCDGYVFKPFLVQTETENTAIESLIQG